MKKLLTAMTLISFSFATKADLVSEKSILLLCSETNNPEYQYLLFMIRDDGWLYDVIHTKEARLKTYGDTHYFFQTLSHDVLDNSYYTQSWVHENDLKLTLLTTSNFSREFLISPKKSSTNFLDSLLFKPNCS